MAHRCLTSAAACVLMMAPAAHATADSAAPGDDPSRPNIMLTGYWPPTNEMLRRFSPNPDQNPQGWIGGDWEGRGYDIYAYFPEFPEGTWPIGRGDFEVDYQDTSEDWWRIANMVQPIAVITFSRGFNNLSWEVEMNQYNRAVWIDDYRPPRQPTPVPPDDSVPPGYRRLSTHPVEEIVKAVNDANIGVNAYVCYSQDGGGFLSEFIAYHGVWYQAIHNSPVDPAWCIAGGHVHVGGQIQVPTAALAAQITLRTVIDHVDSIIGTSAELMDLAALEGTIISGGLQELASSDDEVLRAEAMVTGEAAEAHRLRLLIGAVSNHESPESIAITFEARISDVESHLTLFLHDWDRDAFIEIGAFTNGMQESIHFVEIDGAARFVRTSDDRIELMVKEIVVLPLTLNGFNAFIDHVGLRVR